MWQFEEQEKVNMERCHGLSKFSPPQTTKVNAQFAYRSGYQNCHDQWLNKVKEILRQTGANEQVIRGVKDRDAALEALTNIFTTNTGLTSAENIV